MPGTSSGPESVVREIKRDLPPESWYVKRGQITLKRDTSSTVSSV